MFSARDRLNFIIKDVFNMNLKIFSEQLDVNYGHLRDISCGSKSFSEKKMEEFTKKIQNFGYKIPNKWISEGKGELPFAVFPFFKKNTFIKFDDTSKDQRQALKGILTRVFPFKYACILSDEMNPHYENGDIVFGVKGDPKKIIDKLINKVVIANDGILTYVRRLQKNESGKYFLIADSKDKTDEPIIEVSSEIKWISPIIIHKKPVGKIETLD